MANPLKKDLDHILAHTSVLWSEFRDQRIFMTGGTGFIGTWFIESFAWANERYGLNATISVLTRNPVAFAKKAPHLATNKFINLLEGDMLSFTFPSGSYSYLIHAGTETSHELYDKNPLQAFDSIVGGGRRVLDFACHANVRKMLFLSSGAVYGKQPHDLLTIPEEYNGASALTDVYDTYSEGKRVAELLCNIYSREYKLNVKTARCFSIVGPYMPLDQHFAIGNFIRDSLQGGPIVISGDGSPLRSYLYAADLIIWLWTILIKGNSCRPYNVGSDAAFSIREVANTVAESVSPCVEVIVARQPSTEVSPERFIPSIVRARSELNLEVFVDLPEAVSRTVKWFAHMKE
jgi:dTDP-glucose 4,6-dehydratase